MDGISPELSAKLALGIYDVKNQLLLKELLTKVKLSTTPNNHKTLTAQVGTRLINTRDSFGVCARGSGNYANDLFLIFRGTTGSNYGADILTDFRFGLNITSTGVVVHSGFNHTFNSLKAELENFIAQQTSVNKIHCIGHSLGGAIANLAADWISNTSSIQVRLYTFGAPRVGFGVTGFASKLTTKLSPENIYRIYHGTDPIPMLPLFPYIHAPTFGHAYYQSYNGLVINASAHLMNNYSATVSSKSWPDLFQPEPGFSTDIKSWLKSNRGENTQSATFWHKLNYAAAFVAQSILAVVAVPFVTGLTIADHLAMILKKGLSVSKDIARWAFLLIAKMMRMLGMQVVDTIGELTEQLIKLVLNRILRRIYNEVKKALRQL